MPDKPASDELPEGEIAERLHRTIKRMITTPPQPKRPAGKPASQKSKKGLTKKKASRSF